MQPHSSSLSQKSEPQTTCPLAHDLNNQIAIILTHCELVTPKSALDSKASRHLLAIRNAAQYMADMVRNHHADEIVSQAKMG